MISIGYKRVGRLATRRCGAQNPVGIGGTSDIKAGLRRTEIHLLMTKGAPALAAGAVLDRNALIGARDGLELQSCRVRSNKSS
jgi:hypothetical protein